ncbi:MAG: hypothetical protein JW765_02945 [Deltaproteobacteria bacterium]|nr:hypothetical protein [Candidatus Zymogenaceae bacterium]
MGGLIRVVSLFLLSTGIMILAMACCGEPRDTEEYLEFSSGGEYHPSGCGQWRIKLCGDGSLIVSHTVGGRVKSSDVFMLTKFESRRLFSLFCAADIKRMKSSVRPGVPDEVRYSFGLKDGSGTCNKSVWINDARENPAIEDLVAYLETIVEKYTGEKPVMR